jgi:RNA polymerase sigma-70 factor (ECF subfamily)
LAKLEREGSVTMFGSGRPRDPGEQTGAPVDDAALVQAAQSDLREFAVLYDRYVGSVYGYCYRRVGERSQAEDATSTIFYKALAGLPGFDSASGSFRAWLFAIARNVVIDQSRARQRRPEASLGDRFEIASAETTPEEVAVAGDERDRLIAAVDQLPVEQQAVIELRMAGLNGPEIAEALGRSQGAVRVTQHRAIGKLRTLLTPDQEIALPNARKEARRD